MSERPSQFGPFRLIERLAKGGMAEVFLAEGALGTVVLKRVRPDLVEKPEFKRLFDREARISAPLRHPNVVEILEAGHVDGVPYLAMEHIDGLDLMELFRRVRRHGDGFPPAIAAYIAHGVASALAYARGIVHCDITPHNIMISYAGRVALLDFGIAHADRDEEPVPAKDAHSIRGKVAYMSPEQAHGAAVDERTDVYALGAVLFEMLSGRLLFRHKDPRVALSMVRNQTAPRLRDLAPALPEPLRALVERARDPDPQRRHPHGLALRQALASFLSTVEPAIDAEQLAGFVRRYAPSPTTPSAAGELGIRRALDAARRARGDAEAYFYLTRALPALQPGEPLRFLVLLRREQALRGCARPRERARDLRALVVFAKTHGTPAQQHLAALRLLRFYVDLGRSRAARRCLARMDRTGPHAAEIEALACRVELGRGDLEAAFACVTRGLQGYPPAGRARIHMLRALALTHAARGELQRATTTLRAALELAQAAALPRLQASVLVQLARVAARQHDDSAAIAALTASLRLDRTIGDRMHTAHKLALLGHTHTRLGLTDRAVALLGRARDLLAPLPRAPHRGLVLAYLGEALGHTQAWREGLTLLRDAETRARRDRDGVGELEARLRQVELLQRHEGPASHAARALAETVLCGARACGHRELVCRGLDALARAAMAADDGDSALTYAAEAVSMVRGGVTVWEAPFMFARLADLRRARGEREEAEALAGEAVAALHARLARLPRSLRSAYAATPEVRELLGRWPGRSSLS